MHVRSDFPRPVREVLNTWIPLSDGVRLAARIWMPVDAEQDPVPAILEYIPYRKNDGTATGDALTHPYFAGHGYAGVRVDIRGTGESDGLLFDEYLPQEQSDALEIIAWLAEQPWCSGNVGMMGISWGGFNSLQVAALRPPALKAIITVCSTDDRYADDVHYMGGCLLNDGVSWGSGIFTVTPKPPDPLWVGERWREMWLHRLENAPLALADWIAHQRRDAFWKQGSVCEDYAAIECAVFAVGGWVDGYSNAILRLLEHIQAPCKGLIGPWTHVYPHFGFPEPAIGFLQEALRWWDRWLKDLDTGVEKEPDLRCWMQEAVTPDPMTAAGEGYWTGVSHWPIASQRNELFRLDNGGLHKRKASTVGRHSQVSSPQSTGIAAGEWCPRDGGGNGPEFQSDQRIDDANSLTYDSDKLSAPVAIIGAPEVDITVCVDRPDGLLAVRLCDIAPDGTSTRVTFALLNLAHRNHHEHCEPMAPDTATRIVVSLNATAYTFAAGHRIRLAISTSYWPMVWPSPEQVTLAVTDTVSCLTLPLADDVLVTEAVSFEAPESSPPMQTIEVEPVDYQRFTQTDLGTGDHVYTSDEHRGKSLLSDINLTVGSTALERYRINDFNPTSAMTEMQRTCTWQRDDWSAQLSTHLTLTCSTTAFFLKAHLCASEGQSVLFEREWDEVVPRDHT